MSLSIEDIEKTLRDNAVAVPTINVIITQLEAIEADKKEERAETPKQKNQFVWVTNDANSGWLLQLPESEDVGTAESKLRAAIKSYNTTRRAKKKPVKSWADCMEHVTRKFTKENKVHIKTKELTRALQFSTL